MEKVVERGVMAGPFGAIGGSVVETARSTQQQRVECADIDVPNAWLLKSILYN